MASTVTKNETQLLIGGKWVEAGDGTYDIVNPATEEVVGQAPNASVAAAEAAAAAARAAFPAWAATPVEERLALLKKASATFDKTEQDRMLAQAHGMVVDGAPWLFIVHDLNPRAMSKKVTGFKPAQSWYQDFTQITMA